MEDNEKTTSINTLQDPEILRVIKSTEMGVNQTLLHILEAEHIPPEQYQIVMDYCWSKISEFSEITSTTSHNALKAYTKYLREHTDYSETLIRMCECTIRIFFSEAINQGMPPELAYYWL